jgi:hypothetical protein
MFSPTSSLPLAFACRSLFAQEEEEGIVKHKTTLSGMGNTHFLFSWLLNNTFTK